MPQYTINLQIVIADGQVIGVSPSNGCGCKDCPNTPELPLNQDDNTNVAQGTDDASVTQDAPASAVASSDQAVETPNPTQDVVSTPNTDSGTSDSQNNGNAIPTVIVGNSVSASVSGSTPTSSDSSSS